jgi:hypothetical protein
VLKPTQPLCLDKESEGVAELLSASTVQSYDDGRRESLTGQQ